MAKGAHMLLHSYNTRRSYRAPFASLQRRAWYLLAVLSMIVLVFALPLSGILALAASAERAGPVRLVKDLTTLPYQPGFSSPISSPLTRPVSYKPYTIADANGMALFAAWDSANGTELWKSDSTPAGTVFIKDIRPGAASSEPA